MQHSLWTLLWIGLFLAPLVSQAQQNDIHTEHFFINSDTKQEKSNDITIRRANALNTHDVDSGNILLHTLIVNTNGSLQRDGSGAERGANAIDLQITRMMDSLVASGSYSVIAGGASNLAKGMYATVSGGIHNRSLNSYATAGGGISNIAGGKYATVSGGWNNVASSDLATIGGGQDNRATGVYATIGGGTTGSAAGNYAAIGGGIRNSASGASAVVGGGAADTASGDYATVDGGFDNNASGGYAAVGGGAYNIAAGDYSAIAGGRGLTLDASADRSFGFLANDGSYPMTIRDPDVAVFGNADLWLANNDGSASEIRFYESSDMIGDYPGGANYSALRSGEQEGDLIYILPTSAPEEGEMLGVAKTTTAGTTTTITLTWQSNERIVRRDEHRAREEEGMNGMLLERIEELMEVIEKQGDQIKEQAERIEALEAGTIQNGLSQTK